MSWTKVNICVIKGDWNPFFMTTFQIVFRISMEYDKPAIFHDLEGESPVIIVGPLKEGLSWPHKEED